MRDDRPHPVRSRMRRGLAAATVAAAMLVAGADRAAELTHIKLGILKLGAMTNVWLA